MLKLLLECYVVELCICIKPLQAGVNLDIGATPVSRIVELVFCAPFMQAPIRSFLLCCVNQSLAEFTEAASFINISPILLHLDDRYVGDRVSLSGEVFSNWVDGEILMIVTMSIVLVHPQIFTVPLLLNISKLLDQVIQIFQIEFFNAVNLLEEVGDEPLYIFKGYYNNYRKISGH